MLSPLHSLDDLRPVMFFTHNRSLKNNQPKAPTHSSKEYFYSPLQRPLDVRWQWNEILPTTICIKYETGPTEHNAMPSDMYINDILYDMVVAHVVALYSFRTEKLHDCTPCIVFTIYIHNTSEKLDEQHKTTKTGRPFGAPGFLYPPFS